MFPAEMQQLFVKLVFYEELYEPLSDRLGRSLCGADGIFRKIEKLKLFFSYQIIYQIVRLRRKFYWVLDNGRNCTGLQELQMMRLAKQIAPMA